MGNDIKSMTYAVAQSEWQTGTSSIHLTSIRTDLENSLHVSRCMSWCRICDHNSCPCIDIGIHHFDMSEDGFLSTASAIHTCKHIISLLLKQRSLMHTCTCNPSVWCSANSTSASSTSTSWRGRISICNTHMYIDTIHYNTHTYLQSFGLMFG